MWQAGGGGLRSSPVYCARRRAQAVVDESHVALVQLQSQGVIVALVQKDAIVLVSGHLQRGMWLGPPGLTAPPALSPLPGSVFGMTPGPRCRRPLPRRRSVPGEKACPHTQQTPTAQRNLTTLC